MGEPAEINVPFGEIDRYVEKALGRMTITAAIVSMHNRESGQLILHNPRHDKKAVAARLRLCARILDPDDTEAVLIEALQNIVANGSVRPDASMGGTTDICAIPLDDFDAARAAIAKATGATPDRDRAEATDAAR